MPKGTLADAFGYLGVDFSPIRVRPQPSTWVPDASLREALEKSLDMEDPDAQLSAKREALTQYLYRTEDPQTFLLIARYIGTVNHLLGPVPGGGSKETTLTPVTQ